MLYCVVLKVLRMADFDTELDFKKHCLEILRILSTISVLLNNITSCLLSIF